MTRIFRLGFGSLSPLVLALLFSGCGPITASQAISDARLAVDVARVAVEKASRVEAKRLAAQQKADASESGPNGTDRRLASIVEKDRASLRGQLHFEYFSAIAYFDKAREEEGYSDYQSARRLAEKAEGFARAAKKTAQMIVEKKEPAPAATPPVATPPAAPVSPAPTAPPAAEGASK
jgi:hypothetical protein